MEKVNPIDRPTASEQHADSAPAAAPRSEHWSRRTNLAPSREIPAVWKITALPRLHRLHGALRSREKNAFVIGFLNERETIAIRSHARVLLDEIVLTHLEECRERANFVGIDIDKAGPTAAVRAAFANVCDFVHLQA
jgi:hypothetical protein